jgi:topoisomerase-4 subunit A
MSRFSFITDNKDSQLEVVSTDWRPQVKLVFVKEKGKERRTEIINIEEFIAIKGEKALGNKLTSRKIKEINLIDSLPYEKVVIEESETELEGIDVNGVEEETKSDDINAKIKLEISKDITEDKKTNPSEDSDDEYTGGQITLEL